MNSPTIRIGILGAARIAPQALIRPARSQANVEIVAVAARDRDRAAAFAGKHGIPRVHDSYEALLADPEIDAVYNPLPNSLHAEWTIRALQAGKHVLCEKPMAANADEAAEMAKVADETGLVLFEAFHYRYHPLALRAKAIIDAGEIGALRHIDAQFCTLMLRPNDIRLRYDLGGGALMDLGCYTINMIRTSAVLSRLLSEQKRHCPRPRSTARWMSIFHWAMESRRTPSVPFVRVPSSASICVFSAIWAACVWATSFCPMLSTTN